MDFGAAVVAVLARESAAVGSLSSGRLAMLDRLIWLRASAHTNVYPPEASSVRTPHFGFNCRHCPGILPPRDRSPLIRRVSLGIPTEMQ